MMALPYLSGVNNRLKIEKEVEYMGQEKLTFKGGVNVPHYKALTENKALERAEEPKVVYIPLQQHIGAPCEPVVNVGDEVKIGQLIGKSEAFVSARIHSSIAGKVKEITNLDTPGGLGVTCIVIESDGSKEKDDSMKIYSSLEEASPEEILEAISLAGITGLGGASFPTHVKLSPPKDKVIDTIILNGAECEPYLTADHRLMLENTSDVVFGIRAIMKALGVNNGIIAIEDNKMDAVEAIRAEASKYSNVEVKVLKAKYPQGDEKRIISAVTGREVPSGALPMEVGCVVNNIGTAKAIADAILRGKPLYERVITITGNAIGEPKNLVAKIGTPFKELIRQAGGFKTNPGKIVMGGPMMGLAQYSIEVPMVKGTSGILTFTEEEAKPKEFSACIKCGRCLTVCPVHLQPVYISSSAMKNRFDLAEEYNAIDCVECGACSFICPAGRPLTESIRLAKREILAKRKK